MQPRDMLIRHAPALAAILLAAACTTQVQTSSGAAYLERWDAATATAPGVPVAAATGTGAALEDKIRAAAAVEPMLSFPARIGIARIENGALVPVPADEAAAWMALGTALGPGIAQFEPVDPLVAEMTRASAGLAPARGDVGGLVAIIRLGAARQHLDAVLIYAVGTTTETTNTAIAFADLTIIGGAFLPTREIEAAGRASALLIDVRNGYPYGRTQAEIALAELSTSWGSDGARADLAREAEARTVARLAENVEEMFDLLIREMVTRGG